MKFIVKLFPEITIKSRPVRKRFIQRLQNNLQIMLRRVDDDIRVSLFWDKLEVVLPEEKLQFATKFAALCPKLRVSKLLLKLKSLSWARSMKLLNTRKKPIKRGC